MNYLQPATEHGRGPRALIGTLARTTGERPLPWWGWTLVCLLLAALLLPTLLLPLGPDQSLFYVSGEKILQGALHYRDIVDIKPPLIYYLYAGAIALFGGGAHSIRFLDLLVQGATCWLMISTIRRAGGGDLMAALAPLCYLLIYLGQGYGYPAQSEAWTGLLGLGAVRLQLFGDGRYRLLLAGLLVGMLALTKFTLAAMLGPLLLGALFLMDDMPWRRRLADCALLCAGFAIAIGALLLYLTAGDAWHGFRLMSEFTGTYAKIELRSPGQWFRNLLTLPAIHFAENYSLLLLLATVTGAALSLRAHEAGSDAAGYRRIRLLLRLCAITFLVMLLTIVVEGKYPPYHYMRLYPFGAVLAATGLVRGIGLLARRTERGGYGMLLLPAIVAGALLFGPFIRYGWHTLVPAMGRLRETGITDERALQEHMLSMPDGEFRAMGSMVKMRMKPDDRFYALSSKAGMLYMNAGVVPELPVFHSAFIIAPFAPQEWRDTTRAYLLTTRPRFIVADLRDNLPGITGVNTTSAQALLMLPGVEGMLRAEYEESTHWQSFTLYERKR